MSKIKDAKRSILQIMPAEGWVAVFQDEDGELSETVRVPLFAWALVREITKKRRIRRSRACIWMTKDRYMSRVGVMDFCGTNASTQSGPSHRGNDQGLWEK
jgi:hypothetical protein